MIYFLNILNHRLTYFFGRKEYMNYYAHYISREESKPKLKNKRDDGDTVAALINYVTTTLLLLQQLPSAACSCWRSGGKKKKGKVNHVLGSMRPSVLAS